MSKQFLGYALAAWAVAANGLEALRETRVDAEGVWRWADDGSEVALVGVNLYTPFSVDYAELKRLGVDHRQAIRDDVAHLRRLGLGCVRLHCFDREFSDAEGNLVENEHVALLDFLIAECASNGLYTVLTPIAWWGGHYAPGSLRGFSDLYEMQQMTTDPQAWAAQARFLRQFAERVNRLTGRRYADDPAVLAFECINEPLYPPGTPDARVTAYINALADALRASGTRKPIFYNSWQGRNAAAGAARVEGVTCSSYPTGLVAGRAYKGSQAGRVHGSSLRPDDAIRARARMAYEFDAADVPGSHMYPLMAKLFRAEGVQVAAQFQYDPLALAAENRNWQTHHLNLVYTPGKALSLAIAAEVFRRVLRGAAYQPAEGGAVAFAGSQGLSPASGDATFRVSGGDDLSEMATEEEFLYSNATSTRPPNPAALRRVWGCGSSPVVAYAGTGAYFLDRAAPGVWRLQLYPDVFVAADAYTGSAETKVYAVPGEHAMTLRLPDLGDSFSLRPFDGQASGERAAKAEQGAFSAPPGDYLLTRSGWQLRAAALQAAAALAPRYAAPAPSAPSAPLVRADPPRQWRAGLPLTLRAQTFAATRAALRLTSPAGDTHALDMASTNLAEFAAEAPGAWLTPGLWHVAFRASGPSGETAYPDARAPDAAWFPSSDGAVPLIDMARAAGAESGLERVGHGVRVATVEAVDGRADGARALRLTVEGVGEGSSAAGFTLPFRAPAGAALGLGRGGLRIVARGGPGGARAELGFRMKNGQGLGCNLRVGAGWSETVVPAADLIPLWGLPSAEAFRWEEVARVTVLTGAWLLKREGVDRQTFDLASAEWVRLEQGFPLRVAGGDTPWSLFDADAWLRVPAWSSPLKRWRVSDDQGMAAVHLGAETFAGEHESLSLRAACDGKDFAQLWQTDGSNAVLHVRARATCPHTTTFELALIEDGGVPWGTEVRLTPEWQTVRIPVRSLRLFTQWGQALAAQAGPHLRLSRLQSVNVCFGKWLYREHADEPHGFEIAEIAVGL